MKRFLIATLVAVLLLTALAGCSASMANQGNEDSGAPNYSPSEGSANGQDNGSGDKDATGSPVVSTPNAILRKIIKDVILGLEAKDVEAAYADLLAKAVELGGYEADKKQATSNDIVYIDAVFKIKPENLDAFIAYTDGKYKILSNDTSSTDITKDYYDAKTRLTTMETALETYYGFLVDAKTIEESLLVQDKINSLTLDIESLKGQISMWDSLMAESTVTLHLRQVTDPVETKREINWSMLSWDDMGYLIQSGLTTFVNAVVVFLQWVVIILLILSPVWVIGLIVLFFVLRRHRKIRKQKAAISETKPPVNP